MLEIIKKILLLFFSLLITVLILEVSVRFFIPHPQMYSFPQYMYKKHPSRDYGLTPNFNGVYRSNEFYTRININADGLRDKNYRDKPDNVFRILSLGDSFAMGHGVENKNSYAKLLEKYLNKNLSNKNIVFEVVNAGVDGYSPDMEFLLMKEIWDKYVPDLVMLGLFPTNDFGSDLGKRTVWNGHLVRANKDFESQIKHDNQSEELFLRIKLFLASNSHLYNFITYRIKNSSLGSSFLRYMGLSKDVIKGDKKLNSMKLQKKETFINIMNNYNEISLLKDYPQNNWLKNILIEMKSYIQKRNSQFIIVINPDKSAVHSASFSRDHIDKNKRIANIGRNLNIPVIDPSPFFMKASIKGEELFFLHDLHTNEKGHKLIAQQLFKFLENNDVLKK